MKISDYYACVILMSKEKGMLNGHSIVLGAFETIYIDVKSKSYAAGLTETSKAYGFASEACLDGLDTGLRAV